MNKSTYQNTLTWRGTSVAARTRVNHEATHRLADTTDLGDYIANAVGTNMSLDVTAEATYKNQPGRKWTLTIGSYAGADLYNVSVNCNNREVDVTDNADYVSQRVPFAGTWSIAAMARYNATVHFLSQCRTAASSNTSVAYSLTDAQGSTVLQGVGRISRAGFGGGVAQAVDQPVELQAITVATVGVNALFPKWTRLGVSGLVSQACKITNAAGTTVLSGTGFPMAATLAAPQDGPVTMTMRAAINAFTTLS